jgi:hypothetical protein
MSMTLSRSRNDFSLCLQAPPSQSLGVFTSVIVICSVGALVVTVQAKVRSSREPRCPFTHSPRSCLVVECQSHPYIVLFHLTHSCYSSFFQGLCVLGYCIAPLDIAALISCFVRVIYVRAPVALLAWAWCIWGMYCHAILEAAESHHSSSPASVNFLDGTKIEQQRILLAVYPLL